MQQRVFNFSAGPAALPLPVLEQAQRDLLALPGVGASVLEISHRSQTARTIQAEAASNLRALLGIPDNYRVLFLQGGSRLQFSMVPMNLLRGAGNAADYVLTGSWGRKAIEQAELEGPVRIAWDGCETGYDRVPPADEIALDPRAAYVHITSNETIEGVEFPYELDTGPAPLVCDASSDFLSRPMSVERYGIIYACAQKNAGPAGVTLVIIRDDLLARSADNLPGMLNYRTHAENDSVYNTSPVFAIYITMLVTRWLLEEFGTLDKVAEHNRAKARLLYEVLDASPDFYRGHAHRDSRSMMNVTFRLPTAELEAAFVSQAAQRGLCELKGHRSVGGIRASIYNAMPREGVERLAEFMRAFCREAA